MQNSHGDPFDVALAYYADAKSKLHLLLELTDDPEILRLGRQAVRELDKRILAETYKHCHGIELDNVTIERYLDHDAD
jgi:hypothetical protein